MRNPSKADQDLARYTDKKARSRRNYRTCPFYQKWRVTKPTNGVKGIKKFLPFDVRTEKACNTKKTARKKIPVLLLNNSTKYDLEDTKTVLVVENLHRNKMNTNDMTAACVFLAESVGKAKAAKFLGMSTQTLKKYIGFTVIPEKLKQYVPKELSWDDVAKLYQIISNVPNATKIAEKIISLDQKLRKEYLKA